MPLIRYRTGDFGVLDVQPCPCGRRHKTLSSFAGREPGAFTLPDGRPVAVNLVRRAAREPAAGAVPDDPRRTAHADRLRQARTRYAGTGGDRPIDDVAV